MSLKIYGIAASRASRPLWVAEELGLAYEHVAVSYAGGATRKPEFLVINPNGHIPVLDDGGIVVWESMACCLYLAQRFAGAGVAGVAPASHQESADVLRWTFWAVTECEKDALTVLMHTRVMPADRRKPVLAEEARRRLRVPLAVLDAHLANKNCLAGERFTVGDICVASVLAWVNQEEGLMAEFSHVAGWLERCLARPAQQRVRAMAAIV
ncbi:MAG: glutathione S-transferase family protein [Pseudomonadota bacterium]